MMKIERDELFDSVISDWQRVTSKLFGKHRPNISCLGNTWNHLHFHLIPRYERNVTFRGISFIDPNPSGNYSPYPKMELDERILFEIRDKMKRKLIF